MKRLLFAFTGILAAVFIMTIGGVDNIARGQSSLPAPAGVSAVNGSNLGEVDLSWNAVAGATYYRIGWMADEDYQAALQEPEQEWLKEFRYSNIVNRDQPTWTVTRLTPGIKYWIIVGSHNDFYGAPEWSTWAELTLTAASSTVIQPPPGGDPLPPSQDISSTSRYLAIDAGLNHTCGIKLDNALECWGDNTHGQTNAPEGQFLKISAGGVYSCGIDNDNELQCWGHAAMPPTPSGDYTAVSVGDEHACAITVAEDTSNGRPENRVVCWGLPNNDGRTVNQEYRSPSPWQTVGAGSNYNCAILVPKANQAPGSYCWGSDEGVYRFPAYYFDGGYRDMIDISAGDRHICVLHEHGDIRCRGNDVHGQATGQPNAQNEGAVEDFYTYDAISAGGSHTCGLRTTGNIRCWGDNLRGQATPPGGNDERQRNRQGVGDFKAISAGDSHTCGLRRDGTVVCWGLNDHSQATPH